MQRLEISGAVRPLYGSLGVKELRSISILSTLSRYTLLLKAKHDSKTSVCVLPLQCYNQDSHPYKNKGLNCTEMVHASCITDWGVAYALPSDSPVKLTCLQTSQPHVIQAGNVTVFSSTSTPLPPNRRCETVEMKSTIDALHIKKDEWMAAILHDRCKSVYNVHTHELPIIQKFAHFCNTHTGHFPILYSHKRELYWHDSQQIPGYISDHWGQIMEQGEPTPFVVPSACWPHEWKTTSPRAAILICVKFCLFKRNTPLSRAHWTSMLRHVSTLCVNRLLWGGQLCAVLFFSTVNVQETDLPWTEPGIQGKLMIIRH